MGGSRFPGSPGLGGDCGRGGSWGRDSPAATPRAFGCQGGKKASGRRRAWGWGELQVRRAGVPVGAGRRWCNTRLPCRVGSRWPRHDRPIAGQGPGRPGSQGLDRTAWLFPQSLAGPAMGEGGRASAPLSRYWKLVDRGGAAVEGLASSSPPVRNANGMRGGARAGFAGRTCAVLYMVRPAPSRVTAGETPSAGAVPGALLFPGARTHACNLSSRRAAAFCTSPDSSPAPTPSLGSSLPRLSVSPPGWPPARGEAGEI